MPHVTALGLRADATLAEARELAASTQVLVATANESIPRASAALEQLTRVVKLAMWTVLAMVFVAVFVTVFVAVRTGRG